MATEHWGPYDWEDDEADLREFANPNRKKYAQCSDCGEIEGFHYSHCMHHDEEDVKLLIMKSAGVLMPESGPLLERGPQLFAVAVSQFQEEFSAWLNTNEGEFEQHEAERNRP